MNQRQVIAVAVAATLAVAAAIWALSTSGPAEPQASERTVSNPSDQEAQASGGRGLVTEGGPSLERSVIPAEESVEGSGAPSPSGDHESSGGDSPYPSEYTGPRDLRVLKLYTRVSRQLEQDTPAEEDDESTSKDLRQRLARYAAILQLIQQQRFFFMGDPQNQVRPPRVSTSKYTSVGLDGLLLVFEFPMSEFPELFEGN